MAKVGHFVLSASLVVSSLVIPMAAPLPAAAMIADGMPAIDLIGQYDKNNDSRMVPDFSQGAYGGGANKYGLYSPNQSFLDLPNRRLYVADASNNRILVYTVNANGTLVDQVADYVLGQADFIHGFVNRGGATPTASTLSNPRAVAWDALNSRLFVVDGGNNRVLVFNLAGGITNGMAASAVLGQTVLTCGRANHDGACGASLTAPTASTMNAPSAVAWDVANNRLFVSDYSNHRVLAFESLTPGFTDGPAATHVLGQDVKTCGFANHNALCTAVGTTTGATMNLPYGLVWDVANNRLFVADTGNNRVLAFESLTPGFGDGTTATHILGQDLATCGRANHNAGCTASLSAPEAFTMSSPRGLAWDVGNSRLFVADAGNSRILAFESLAPGFADGTVATRVLGQDGMNCGRYNHDGSCVLSLQAPTSVTMNQPFGVTWDGTNGRLIVNDYLNNRVLAFDSLTTGFSNGRAADWVIGQYAVSTWPILPTTPTFTQGFVQSGPGPWSVGSNASSMAIDRTRHRLYRCDPDFNRVVVYNLDDRNRLIDRNADYVLGQPNFFSVGIGVTDSQMYGPYGVAFDEARNRLFVAEGLGSGTAGFGNNRILVFDLAGGITNGMAASQVIGQVDFVSRAVGTVSQSTFYNVRGMVYDPDNDLLYAGDYGFQRVLIFDARPSGSPSRTMCGVASTGIVNGMMNASCVIGQPNFSTTGYALNQTSVAYPLSLALDSVHHRLFVHDLQSRVMVYNLPADMEANMTNNPLAANVLGQTSFTSQVLVTSDVTMNAGGNYGIDYDPIHDRIFVTSETERRILVWNLAGGITNGMPAAQVIGQSDFTSTVTYSGAAATASNFSIPRDIKYDQDNDRLYAVDRSNYRVLIFDVSMATGTTESTTDGSLTLSRLAAGESATGSLNFTLAHNLSSQLTVTFDPAFTITAPPSTAASSSCLSNFVTTSNTITADKTNCAGPVTVGGFTVALPGATGVYRVSWTNDDPGFGSVYIVTGDTITINATVDPSIVFEVGAVATAGCTGTFVASDWSIDLGHLNTGRRIASSGDASGAQLVCTRLSTNATSGAIVTVKNKNGASGLVSASVPADLIPSATGAVTDGTPRYGLCYSTVTGDEGYDLGVTPAATAPSSLAGSYDAGTCTASVVSAAESVTALSTTPTEAWRVPSVTSNAFAALRVKAAISGTQPAHNDYSDTLTFVATATF